MKIESILSIFIFYITYLKGAYMTLIHPIIDAIWELPWYKVLYIAVVDDFIFMVKTWPFWLIVSALIIYYYQWQYVWKPNREAKKRNKDK